MWLSLVVSLSLLVGGLQAEEAKWCRWPALSPDGSQLVFSCMGDLWLVSAEGGEARQLTRAPGLETRPCWSPDGRWIAYAADLHGNLDVFLVSATGGMAKRVTWHSRNDWPWCFSPDSERLLFGSARMDDPASSMFPGGYLPELYEVAIAGGRPRQLLSLPVEQVALSEGGLLYEVVRGMEDEFRKHHTSSAARDLWLYKDGRHTQITSFEGEDREPVWLPQGRFAYLSERSGSMNVWSANLDGEQQQLSFHQGAPVRGLSADLSGKLCYSQDGQLWTLQPGEEPNRLSIVLNADRQADHPQNLVLDTAAEGVTLSPDGGEVAFTIRGELFVASVEEGTTRRITNTAGQERDPQFIDDGRGLVFAAERGGSWDLYRVDLAQEEDLHFYSAGALSETLLLGGRDDYQQPLVSPDGEYLAFLARRNELRVMELESGRHHLLVPDTVCYSYSDGDQHFAWSPDSRWLCITYPADHRWSDEIGVVSRDGGEIHNFSMSGYEDWSPVFSGDGRAILFFSNRLGLRAHGGWGFQSDVFAAWTDQVNYDWSRISSERMAELTQEDEEDEDEKKHSRNDEKPDTLRVRFDWERPDLRTTRMSARSGSYSDMLSTADGKSLLLLGRDLDGWHLWSRDWREGEQEELCELPTGGSLLLGPEDEFVLVHCHDGSIHKVALEGGDSEEVCYSAEMQLNPAAEWRYFFDHIWNQTRVKFYTETMHGVDWNTLRETYLKYLPWIDNKRDLAECFSEMLGELNASHTGAFVYYEGDNFDATAQLGVLHDPDWMGEGIRVAEVLPGGPCAGASSRIGPGTLILSIAGASIAAGENWWPLLNRSAGEPVWLELRDGRDTWRERVVLEAEWQTHDRLYKRWVERNAQLVDSLSQGRLGYVHIAQMSGSSFRTLYHEALGRWSTREALVVDSRYNGGGNLTNELVAFLSGRRTYRNYVRPGPRQLGEEPWDRWNRPSIVLMNESNYSDAHLFPYAYKDNGLGSLVGMPVAGTGTAVWWEGLMDEELVFGIPEVGIETETGHLLENNQLEPDYLIENTPESILAGRDLQLEAAVRILLSEVDAEKQ